MDDGLSVVLQKLGRGSRNGDGLVTERRSVPSAACSLKDGVVVSAHTCLCVGLCLCVHICVYIHLCVCVCTCLCVYTCECV